MLKLKQIHLLKIALTNRYSVCLRKLLLDSELNITEFSRCMNKEMLYELIRGMN